MLDVRPARIAALCLALLLPAAPGSAREEGMELQRCIWRCLAASPGPESSQYNACVARTCVAVEPAARGWTVGTVRGGAGRYANVDEAGGERAIAYMCDRAGASQFVLDAGLQGPGGVMRLVVDGRAYPLRFARASGPLTAPVAPDAEVVEALRGGSSAELRGTDGRRLATFSLAGSSRALGQVLGFCAG